MELLIRRFKTQDAQSVSELIIKTMQTSNTKDYSTETIFNLLKRQTPEHVLERASWTHYYVVENDKEIIGCGAIGPYWEKEDESEMI